MSLLLFWQASTEVTSTASWSQAAATWSATASERINATASFSQSATWAATASEAIPGTAAWTQTAAWDAEGLATNPVTGTASFEQAAAAWVAATAQLISGSATFVQAAAQWDAVASLALQATAAFTQAPASWSAEGSEQITGTAAWEQAAAAWTASDSSLISGSATWQQDAAWSATADSTEPVVTPPAGAATIRGRAMPMRTTPLPIRGQAVFIQQPASWRATVTVHESEEWLLGLTEDSLLALV